jgi:transposase
MLRALIGGIVPEVWVPPMPVRELRGFISYRGRLVKTGAMIRNRLQSLLHKHNLMLPEEGILDQAWWNAQGSISSLEKMQIHQELALLDEIEKHKAAVDEELGRQFTSKRWGSQAVRLVQLPGVGVVIAMTVLSAIGDTPAPTAGAVSRVLKVPRNWLDMPGLVRACTTAARHTRKKRSLKREERNCAGQW